MLKRLIKSSELSTIRVTTHATAYFSVFRLSLLCHVLTTATLWTAIAHASYLDGRLAMVRRGDCAEGFAFYIVLFIDY